MEVKGDVRDGRANLRDRIVAEIVRVTQADGKPPGRRRFAQATGISEYQVSEFWPTWAEALNAAGVKPNVLNQPIPEDELLRMLADLTRRLGAVPSHNQVVFESKNAPGFPHYKTWTNRFGDKKGIVSALRAWVANHPEYGDLESLLPHRAHVAATPSRETATVTAAALSESYVPPVIASLEALARGDDAIAEACRQSGRDPNHEFERRVGIAFQLLGFEVEQMGQGYGRVADGIASCASGGWSVIYDAKVRRDRYRLLTEDRKFREYIETHVPAVRSRGNQRCYFAIISSQFSDSDLERAHELVRLTDVKACVFIEAAALVALVEERMMNVASFAMDQLERLLMRTRILTVEEVGRRR